MTPKQEAFVLAYLETGNASEAYKRAYNTSAMKDESIRVQAAKMLASPNIALRVQELRAPAVQAAQMTLEGHIADLKNIRDAALSEGKFSAAVTAEMARGKASGFYVDKVELGGTLVVVKDYTGRSDGAG